jgi:hypothetical protein
MQQCPQCHYFETQATFVCSRCGAPLPMGDLSPLSPPPESSFSSPSPYLVDSVPFDGTFLRDESATLAMPTWEPTIPISQPVSVFSPPRFRQWWRWVIPAMVVMLWAIWQNSQYWSEAMANSARVMLVSGLVISMFFIITPPRRDRLIGILAPAISMIFLLVAGGILSQLAPTMDRIQAQQAERNGAYEQALVYYRHGHDRDDIARVQLILARASIQSRHFADARSYLDSARESGSSMYGEAILNEYGTLYFLWGQELFDQHDIAGAREQWGYASAHYRGTPDGDRANVALAAPQVVTGRLTWLGLSLPGTRVALLSAWSITPDHRILQDNGQRLEATTGSDGTFSINGALPGRTYAFVWVGSFGDTTHITSDGRPAYTVAITSLQGSDLGTINVVDSAIKK